jgi:hypothetical protein
MPYHTYHPDSHQALPAPSASVSVPVKQVNRGPSMPASRPHKAHSRPMFEQEGSTYFCTSKASKIECLVCRQSRPHKLRAKLTTSNTSACVGIPQHTSAYLSIRRMSQPQIHRQTRRRTIRRLVCLCEFVLLH